MYLSMRDGALKLRLLGNTAAEAVALLLASGSVQLHFRQDSDTPLKHRVSGKPIAGAIVIAMEPSSKSQPPRPRIDTWGVVGLPCMGSSNGRITAVFDATVLWSDLEWSLLEAPVEFEEQFAKYLSQINGLPVIPAACKE